MNYELWSDNIIQYNITGQDFYKDKHLISFKELRMKYELLKKQSLQYLQFQSFQTVSAL